MSTSQLEYVQKAAAEKLAEHSFVKFSFVSFDTQLVKLNHYLVSHSLAKAGIPFLENIVIILLKECIANAVKANLKRAYFQKRKVDIFDKEGYEDAMADFRAEGVEKLSEYIPIMEKSGLKVTIAVQLTDDKVNFFIQNNTSMTPQELLRVRSRVKQVSRLESLADLLEDFADDTEGAGLGLLMNLMLLKTSGIGTRNFDIQSNEQFTQVRLTVPIQVNRPANISKMVDHIHGELQSIPTFPASIQRVIEMCDNVKNDISDIAREIESDPSLAAGILKIANSSGFSAVRNVNSLQKAATVLGTQMIKQMAIAHSAKTILDKDQKMYKDFWDHSNRCAFYARSIALKLGFKKQVAEAAYLAGLLHDLGKIVLHSVDPNTIKKINGLAVDRTKMTSATLEEVSLGVSHSEVGAKLAAKWDFPQELVAAIENHHFPEANTLDEKVCVSIVHVADGMLNMEKAQGRYVHFDWEARKTLGLDTIVKLESIHKEIQSEFEMAMAG